MTYWLSFCDPDRPAGAQFLGVSLVDAPSFLEAVQVARQHGCNPGGEVKGCPVMPPLKVPEEFKNRLLSKEEAEQADASFAIGDA